MLKRDFTKSNREYFKQNKKILIAVLSFLLIGILMFAILGMNGNFEIKGYREFTIDVNETISKKFVSHRNEIGNILNSYDSRYDTVLISGEGDNTKYVVRYLKDVDDKEIIEINKLIAEKLEVDVTAISNHTKVEPAVTSKDYVYTIASILLIILIATIFAYARYNGASALALLIACFLGTIGFVSLGSILRLSIGLSYFAMLVILNMLIVYISISLFESMHKSSWLISGDYATAIEKGTTNSKFRIISLTASLMLIGLLLVLFAPSTIKYVALNLMFMAVVLLAIALYVLPFVWSVFITRCRQREYKIKSTETKK